MVFTGWLWWSLLYKCLFLVSGDAKRRVQALDLQSYLTSTVLMRDLVEGSKDSKATMAIQYSSYESPVR